MMNLLKINEMANKLEKWAEGKIPQDFKELGRHGQLIVMFQKQIDDVVLDLLSEMSKVGELVQKKFSKLLTQAKVVDGLMEMDASAAEIEDARLRGFAWQVVEKLRDIAKIARKERKRRIVKAILYLIGGLVTVFAALLTIFHYLGWF